MSSILSGVFGTPDSKDIIIIPKQKSKKDNKQFDIHSPEELHQPIRKFNNYKEGTNEFLKQKELTEYNIQDNKYKNKSQDKYDFLYPTLNDPYFNLKIAKRKEFITTKYDGTIHDIKKHSDLLCKMNFELLPHQAFVKNFLSLNTPYNSLLLYHGLGSGKTCSAIGIAEEMRTYTIQIGMRKKILFIASPNLQYNFKLQLFDERKLIKKEDGEWNLNICIGSSLLKEINPIDLKDLPRKKIIKQINYIINKYYEFMGYGQFANYITENINISTNIDYSKKEKEDMEIKNIKRVFNNRLIIIDEVHNIRLTDENKNNKTAALLMKVAKHAINMRLLLLSATPMYNSHKEIVWITNLMNINDKRSTIEMSDIFDKEGNFKQEGKSILKRKLTGYISYVRGENPYVFPYRIYPKDFSISNSFIETPFPIIQMNGKTIDKPIKYINVYTNKIGEYQYNGYKLIIENISKNTQKFFKDNINEIPSFDNMESFGYRILQKPLEALNIIYPNAELDNIVNTPKFPNDISINKEEIVSNIVGKNGLYNIMKSTIEGIPENIDYKPKTLEKYGRIFNQDNIGKYSAKIASICDAIKNSTGIILIYSQYIDSGILPISLALEEMGISRFCSNSSQNKNFMKSKIEQIDANTMLSKRQFLNKIIANEEGDETTSRSFTPAKYMIICGDPFISPSNSEDIKYANNIENKYGEKVKVILISKAGAEGIDFKNIRQIHIMEPWYNMNRIEQIIGRGVRNLSHCNLPFEERNVQLFLHSTLLSSKENEEAADLYVYRFAEQKALKIGKVTRLLKEVSVDCILNIEQTNFSAEKLLEHAENKNINIKLSNGETIPFRIGDNPFTDVCDYMDNCEHKCYPKNTNHVIDETEIVEDTYNIDYIKSNNDIIIDKIKYLFREQSFYKRDVLISSINITQKYPIEQIYFALTTLIKNKNNIIYDKYGRPGNLINKDNIYTFQPIEITDENSSIYEKTVPIDYKPDHIKLEISNEKQQPITNEIEKMNEEHETVENKDDNRNKTIQTILQYITNNFSLVFQEKQIKIVSGESDWCIHANNVISHLKHDYNISQKQIEKYIVYHILDVMLYDEKLILLNYIYSPSRTFPSPNTLEQKIINYIEQYFELRVLKEKRKMGIVMNKDNVWELYVAELQSNSKNGSSNNDIEWKEGEQEDYTFFNKQLIEKYIINMKNLNEVVGFINYFKHNQIIFKTKNILQERNNKGAACNQAQKADIIKRLNKINEEHSTFIYNKNTDYYRFSLCVILEILLRYYNDKRINNKIYFLTPEESIINNIEKFSRNV